VLGLPVGEGSSQMLTLDVAPATATYSPPASEQKPRDVRCHVLTAAARCDLGGDALRVGENDEGIRHGFKAE
jgi:hypothetical protein